MLLNSAYVFHCKYILLLYYMTMYASVFVYFSFVCKFATYMSCFVYFCVFFSSLSLVLLYIVCGIKNVSNYYCCSSMLMICMACLISIWLNKFNFYGFFFCPANNKRLQRRATQQGVKCERDSIGYKITNNYGNNGNMTQTYYDDNIY